MNKLVGDFGEDVTALLLMKKYKKQGIQVVRVGADNLPYDLIIPYPIANTPFDGLPSVISVKTRGSFATPVPPSKHSIAKHNENLGELFQL